MVTTQTRRALLEGQDLLLQRGELQHPQRVVLCQEAPQGVPASTHAHHHMFTMQHLGGENISTSSQRLTAHAFRQ